MMDDVVIKDERALGHVDQSHSPSKYDEVERVKKRMDSLRKHHDESADIYNRTQPIINQQMHEETLKYLKSGQANGTKTKSQKPRAPKRQRSTTNNTTPTTATNATSNNANISTTNLNNNSIIVGNNGTINNPHATVAQSNPIVNSTLNGLPPQPQLQQAPPSSQGIVQHGHMQQINLYPPRNQHQQPMLMPQHQHQMQPHQPHFKYQAPNSNMYQQQSQPTMHHQYQAQQPQQIYPQQQQLQQPPSHMHPQQLEQGHFVTKQQQQHPGQQQSQHFAQHPNHLNGNHHPHHHHPHQSHVNHVPIISLPNDLDFTLQAGLECDIDSLIKHEMSVEGQLDFNHDLLLKLDNHYHQPHHHQ